MSPRRVITGVNPEGRSCFLFDDQAEMVIWSATDSPADNSGTADAGGGRFDFPTRGTRFVYSDFPPGRASAMHATDTIDYIVVVSGEVVLITETGETLLKAGDVLVDRGVLHGWRNDGDEVCRIVITLCPALPVGGGATVAGEVDVGPRGG